MFVTKQTYINIAEVVVRMRTNQLVLSSKMEVEQTISMCKSDFTSCKIRYYIPHEGKISSSFPS